MDCKHCQRIIVEREGEWIDPNASGDDRIWRYICDEHDTLQANHEPQEKVMTWKN